MKTEDSSSINVWGQGGALFAFSGFDGQTDAEHPLVGSTLTTGRGFVFHTKARPELFVAAVGVTGAPLDFLRAEDRIVAGDVVSSRVILDDGSVVIVSFVFAASNVVLVRIEADTPITGCRVGLRCKLDGESSETEGLLLQEASGEWYALAAMGSLPSRVMGDGVFVEMKERGDSTVFAWAYSPSNGDDAVSLAMEAARTDFEKMMQSRLQFFAGLPKPSAGGDLLRTYYKAASVLKVNSCTPQGDIPLPWTTPDRWPHEHMWIWDSGFHAIGLRHFAPEWAENAIMAVLSKQRENGFIPHALSIGRSSDSNMVQPPILAWSAWKTYEKTKNSEFLEYCYPRLKAMLLYDCRELDKDNNGLSEWDHPHASGMDNSPRFDQPVGDAIDFNSYICNDLEYLAKMAEVLAKPDEAERWLRMRRERAEKINQLLWDEDTGFYYDRSPEGLLIRIKTAAGFTPMFAGICEPRQADWLVARLKNPSEFWRAFPVPTVSADEPSFSDNMWRGPVWINFNYFIIEGLRRYGCDDLAARLRQATLSEIARWYHADGVIYEFYDSESSASPIKLHRKGKGGPEAKIASEYLGTTICDYNWTAALFVDLMLEGAGQ